MNNKLDYVLLICIGLMFFASCGQPKGESKTGNIIPVKVQEIKLSETSGGQNYVGTIEEESASALSFEVSGNVEQVLVSVGQPVKKGQLLAVLNKSSLVNAHQAALASLKQAQDAYKRLTVLHDNNSLPDIKYVEMQTNLDKAKSAESIARKSLRDANLYAPFSGVIGERTIEPGVNVMPTQGVFKLMKIDQVKVKVAVPENEIATTQIGQKAQVYVTALNNKLLDGKIEQRGVVANNLSHTYEVKIGLPNADNKLMPGMVCKVIVDTQRSKGEIVVPNRAVLLSQTGENYVWIAQGDLAVRRTIRIGSLSDFGVEVTAGLQTGDRIIVDGYQKVSDGSKIKLL